MDSGQLHEYEWSCRQLKQAQRDGETTDPLVIDVREARERDFVKLDDDGWVPMGELEHRGEEIEGTDRPVVFYCHHGRRSLRAAKLFRERGVEDVYSLRGGIDEWARSIDPSLPRY